MAVCELLDAGVLAHDESVLPDRFDYIFVRNDLGRLPFSSGGPVKRIDTVGDEPEDKTSSASGPRTTPGSSPR